MSSFEANHAGLEPDSQGSLVAEHLLLLEVTPIADKQISACHSDLHISTQGGVSYPSRIDMLVLKMCIS